MAIKVFITVSSVVLAACLHVVAGLTAECYFARNPCNSRKYQEIKDNVEPCTAGQNLFNCVASVYDTTEQNGVCDKVSSYTLRYDSFREAEYYLPNCNNFVIPDSLKLPKCPQEIALCGTHLFDALGASRQNKHADKCKYLDEFEICMISKTPTCTDRESISTFIQSEKLAFQYQDTCIPNFKEACMTVRAPCQAIQNQQELDNLPQCQVGQTLYNCLGTAYSDALRSGLCEEMSVLFFKEDSFEEASLFRSNCSTFVMPATLQLNTCEQQIAECGAPALKVFLASRDNTALQEKCKGLAEFKSCMETQTPQCTDRQRIDTMLQKDLIYYQYQSTCIDTTTTTTTTTTKAPTAKPEDTTTATTTTTPNPNSSTKSPTPTSTTTTTTTTPKGGNGGNQQVVDGYDPNTGTRMTFSLVSMVLTLLACLL